MLAAAALALCFLLLTYGPQDVLAFHSISFSSIAQCGSFNISFAGGKTPPALPLTLTVIPFNSTTPLFIPIPRDAWNGKTGTGAAITFLPFAAGMEFVASLDDANGQATGKVSDVIKIQPSDNSECLFGGGNTTTGTLSYTLDGSLLQCEPFSLSFNSAAESSPTIRVFRPKGSSFIINSTFESPGVVTCITEIQRGKEVVMLFDDGCGNRQTTDLLTVGGDSSSSIDCFQKSLNSKEDGASEQRVLPRNAIIGIVAASVSVVIGVAILMGVYVCRRKRLEKNQAKPVLPTTLSKLSLHSPHYVSGITLFGTAGVPSPVSPNFGYVSANGRSRWVRPDPPASLFGLSQAVRDDGYRESTHSGSSDFTHSTEPRHGELDVDMIPDMATIDSHSLVVAPSVQASPSYSHNRATPDVPIAVERVSVSYSYSGAAGSECNSTQSSPSRSVSTAESGRRILMEPFGADNSWEKDARYPNPAEPVEISAATRVRRVVASIARVESDEPTRR